MSKKRIVILGKLQKDSACEFIQALPDGRHVVEIFADKDRRSLAQNSLYWVFLTQIAGEQGLTKEEVHHDIKKRLLSIILERDFAWYSDLISSIRSVWKTGAKDTANIIFDNVVRLASTRDIDHIQFMELLTDIEKDCVTRGIYLTHPEDLYHDAMR